MQNETIVKVTSLSKQSEERKEGFAKIAYKPQFVFVYLKTIWSDVTG